MHKTAKFLLLLFVFNASIAYSQKDNLNLRDINIEMFIQRCNETICKANASPSCTEKLNNLKFIITEIKNDTTVRHIGVAAFLLATIHTETANKNYNPTSEVKGKVNEHKDYWKPNKITGKEYYGRGWVQLTHYENYKKVSEAFNIDFLNNPEWVLKPEYAYKILRSSILNGWLETYRSSNQGAAGSTPIKIYDFLQTSELDEYGVLDYSLARSVINANGKKPLFEFKPKCFIPTANNIDANSKSEEFSILFENAIRYSLYKEMIDTVSKIELHPLKRQPMVTMGCFIYNSSTEAFANLTNDGYIQLNINGYDELFKPISDNSKNPKGYKIGYKNDRYKVYIKKVKTSDNGVNFPANYDFYIQIFFKNKVYNQKLSGHCL